MLYCFGEEKPELIEKQRMKYAEEKLLRKLRSAEFHINQANVSAKSRLKLIDIFNNYKIKTP
jgi:hypothetical protein